MIEREKVMKALKCRVTDRVVECGNCPYNDSTDWRQRCDFHRLCADALALLKEQDEGVTPIESTTEQKKFADRIGFAVSEFWCGACHFNLAGHPKCCPNCGKAVKWEDD